MKRRVWRNLLGILILGCALSGCSTSGDSPSVTGDTTLTTSGATEVTKTTEATETTAAEPDRFLSAEIPSAAVSENNLLGDPGKETIYIYLPPDYFTSDSRYPVVYYLHGFGDQPGSFLRSSRRQLDTFFASGENAPFMMVEIDGTGFSSGTFYMDSPVTGFWETYVTKEVIPYVDANYRTNGNGSARGICGFSMGGFGALNLALRHPDLFSSVYAMSPGVLSDGALPEAMNTWAGDTAFLTAYGRVFAPVTDGSSPTFGQIPTLDGSSEDNEIVAKWYAGFGNFEEKVDDYLALDQKLAGIGICYGTKDGYTWIPKGCENLAEMLKEKGITPTVFSFEGGHNRPEKTISDYIGPFFEALLSFSS